MERAGALPSSFEQSLGQDTIYCEATCRPEDILYEGSEDEDYVNSEVRKQRYETAGRRFLDGEEPFLLTGSLRGPFDKASGWNNPWRSKFRTAKKQNIPGALSLLPPKQKELRPTHSIPETQVETQDSLECHLPSPESLKQPSVTESHPYLEEEELAMVQNWRDSVRPAPIPKDAFWISASQEDRSMTKRKACGSRWLHKLASKRRRTGTMDIEATDTSLHRQTSFAESHIGAEESNEPVTPMDVSFSSAPAVLVSTNCPRGAGTASVEAPFTNVNGPFNSEPSQLCSPIKLASTDRISQLRHRQERHGLKKEHLETMLNATASLSSPKSEYATRATSSQKPSAPVVLDETAIGAARKLFSSTSPEDQHNAMQSNSVQLNLRDVASESAPFETQNDDSFYFRMRPRPTSREEIGSKYNQPNVDQDSKQISKPSETASRFGISYREESKEDAVSKLGLMDSAESEADVDAEIEAQLRNSMMTLAGEKYHVSLGSSEIPSIAGDISEKGNDAFSSSAEGNNISTVKDISDDQDMSEDSSISEEHSEEDFTLTSSSLHGPPAVIEDGGPVCESIVVSSEQPIGDVEDESSYLPSSEISRSVHSQSVSIPAAQKVQAPSFSTFHLEDSSKGGESNMVHDRDQLSDCKGTRGEELSLTNSTPEVKNAPSSTADLNVEKEETVKGVMSISFVVSAEPSQCEDTESTQALPASQQSPWAGSKSSHVDNPGASEQSPVPDTTIIANTPQRVDGPSAFQQDIQMPWIKDSINISIGSGAQPRSFALSSQSFGSRVYQSTATPQHEQQDSVKSSFAAPSESFRPSTPEPQFSVKSFASFISPSPELRSRQPLNTSWRGSHSHLPFGQGIPASAMLNPWRKGKGGSQRRVSWAPMPNGEDESERGGRRPEDEPTPSDDRVLSAQSRERPASPPPVTPLAELPTSEDDKFSKHFSAVAQRTNILRRRLLPADSQQSLSSPAPLAMAAKFLSVDKMLTRSAAETDGVKTPTKKHEEEEDQEPMDIVEHVFNEIDDYLKTWNVDEELEHASRELTGIQKAHVGLQSPWS